jgi:hypothetical protein
MKAPRDRPPKVVLLLTATIDARNVSFVERTDPLERAKDYRDALRWLAGASLSSPVVFCENSGYDLTEFVRDLEGNGPSVEWLQFCAPRCDPSVGKGRGELGIIRYAVDNSATISSADLVVKVTGRYKILNICRVLASLERPILPMVIADLRRWLSFADSRMFAFHPSFAPRYLYRFESQLDDSKGFYFEHALSRAIHLALAEGATWAPWCVEPDIGGRSGTTGHQYDRSPPKRLFRKGIRRILNYGLGR